MSAFIVSRKWWIIAGASFLVLALAFVSILWIIDGIARHSRAQALDHVSSLISSGRWERAWREIEFHRSRNPDDVAWMAERARLLTVLSAPGAPEAWETVVQLDSSNLEYRSAWTLSLVQARRFQEAETVLAEWKKDAQSGHAFLNASLALAFAQGRDADAWNAARALLELDPHSKPYQLNLAKLQLLLTPKEADEARRTLWNLAASAGLRSEALRTLAADAIRRGDAGGPEAVLRALGFAPGVLPDDSAPLSDRILALEVRKQADIPTPVESLEGIWAESVAHHRDLYRLVSMMTVMGYGGTVITWLNEQTPKLEWAYPLGFALAEAAFTARREDLVARELKDLDWGYFEPVRAFTLARAVRQPNVRKIMLDRALAGCDDSTTRLMQLFQISRTWAWEAGNLHLLRALLLEQGESRQLLLDWMRDLEAMGRTRTLLAATELHLEMMPGDALGLNNRAYFKALLNEDLNAALADVRKARRAMPEVPAIQATEAFVLARLGRYAEAETLLQGLAPASGPSHLLVAALIQLGRGDDFASSLSASLESVSYRLPEEREIRERILEAEGSQSTLESP